MKLICSIATIIERARKAKPVNRNTKFSNLSTEERAALEDLRGDHLTLDGGEGGG